MSIIDLVAPAMQAIAYAMLLVVFVTYYVKAYQQPELRRFWLLFAVAWTMNLVGNIAWIIYYAETQSALNRISLIDLFYATPYILIGFALWNYPKPLGRRIWLWVMLAIFLALGVVVSVYFGYVVTQNKGSLFNFIIYAAYPILDAGLITLAWIRYSASRETRWAKIALLLACGVTSYGLANGIELTGYVTTPILGGSLQNFFWILRHVFMLWVALSVRTPSDVLEG